MSKTTLAKDAYGTLTITDYLQGDTIADFLQQTGQKTEVSVRAPTVGGDQNSSNYVLDPRGVAIKSPGVVHSLGFWTSK